MARPTKFTDEVKRKILDALKGGINQTAAVWAAGIGHSTFHRWMERGERARRGAYREFWEAVKKAEADAVVRNVTLIQRAGMGGEVVERRTITRKGPDGEPIVEVIERKTQPQWQASAWWLERKFPDDWARPVDRQPLQAPGQPVLFGPNYIIIEDRVAGHGTDRGAARPREIDVTPAEEPE